MRWLIITPKHLLTWYEVYSARFFCENFHTKMYRVDIYFRLVLMRLSKKCTG
jgi:hypothetical protein